MYLSAVRSDPNIIPDIKMARNSVSAILRNFQMNMNLHFGLILK